MIVEVCADTLKSALNAEKAGAARIEWCANLPEGGVTPSVGLTRRLRRLLHIDLNVIIRPRGGDFHYSDDELMAMMDDIRFCGEEGCNGVVIGMLTPDGRVDREANRKLVQIACRYGMNVTFHRAFDRTRDLFEALDDIIAVGCNRILTSGGRATALEGADIIRQLRERAGTRIIIMPGAGVTPENAAELIAKTGATEVHGTLGTLVDGEMTFRTTALGSQTDEYFYKYADVKKIAAIVNTQ